MKKRITNNTFIRDVGRPQRPACSWQMHELLGLPRTAKLPPQGMPPRLVQGIKVWVRPLVSPPEPGTRRPHRVMAQCPHCGRILSAGRLQQHVCTQGLIEQYHKAIDCKDAEAINALALAVERAADRSGYTNHGYLAALHTAAERVQQQEHSV